jgi:hypothetical protein
VASRSAAAASSKTLRALPQYGPRAGVHATAPADYSAWIKKPGPLGSGSRPYFELWQFGSRKETRPRNPDFLQRYQAAIFSSISIRVPFFS